MISQGKVSAVLFDFDGVIGNTQEDNFNAWSYAVSPWGATLEREDYSLLEGKRSPEIARVLLEKNGIDTSHIPAVLDRKHDYYETNNNFSFYTGVVELIGTLREKGMKIGVVSGGNRKRLTESASSEFLSLFDVVITGETCSYGKPSPEPYLTASKILGIAPEKCLVIENAPLGIESAKAAGMPCVALATTLAKHHLTRADQVVTDIVELLGQIQSDAAAKLTASRKVAGI